jgi:hypothetical protein
VVDATVGPAEDEEVAASQLDVEERGGATVDAGEPEGTGVAEADRPSGDRAPAALGATSQPSWCRSRSRDLLRVLDHNLGCRLVLRHGPPS